MWASEIWRRLKSLVLLLVVLVVSGVGRGIYRDVGKGRARGGKMGGKGPTMARGGDSRVREVVSRLRRIWGTVKSSSHFSVKNIIVKLAVNQPKC